VVPDELLVAEFAALNHLAPGRVIAAIGTGDHLSFAENHAYGVPVLSAADRRAAVGACARALLGLGLQVWIGGLARATVAVAEEVGAISNFWQADPETVATQAARSRVTWSGMARPGQPDAPVDAAAIVALARPLVTAGASWLVFGWPVDLNELAAAADVIRAD
jgi:alkanesulfonate monooxygenase SsuD/methylene tetrahydromethanopterin reductase-like flavin-dependent oxidoreductase (luciferase family)